MILVLSNYLHWSYISIREEHPYRMELGKPRMAGSETSTLKIRLVIVFIILNQITFLFLIKLGTEKP